MIDKTMCEVLWQNISDFYVNLRVEVAAVSRNRYGVEKTVHTHKILINAIKCYVCLQEIWQTKPCVKFYDEISSISM
jgi:hypothetical protein